VAKGIEVIERMRRPSAARTLASAAISAKIAAAISSWPVSGGSYTTST
jgi:hypothetical protein